MTELSNEGCREQAVKAKQAGNFRLAMRWYNSARARTIGHTKSAMYDDLAAECAKAGGFEFDPSDYAKGEPVL